MPRAIFNNSDELIAITSIMPPIDVYKAVVHISDSLGIKPRGSANWTWKYITQVEFETYQVFGIREINSPKA